MRAIATLVLASTLALPAAPAAAVKLDLNAPGREDSDRDRDTYNKPHELLDFWGIREGMTVMDLFPGNGYVTQLLSQAVGPKGKVVGYASYSHDKFEERMKKAALKNVEEMVLEYPKGFEELDKHLAKLPAASFDAVVTIRNYHDLKNPREVLAQLKRILKPGGMLGIVDSRTWSGKRDETNCRIGEDLIINEVLAAGFRLTGVSSMFSNPKDDYTKAYWDARFIVDQACLRFVR
jgi:predicted methyltransferase